MPTKMTELPDDERGKTVLRVEGSLMRDDAELIERIARDLLAERGRSVAVDLSDLDFLDSESAPILRRIDAAEGIEIEGVEFFLQTIVNDVEKSNN